MERAVFLEPGRPWPEGPWRRIYFGSEFCPWLLPSPEELENALAEAGRRGAAFTLATPYLHDEDLRRATALLERLQGLAGAEVVVNDWGLAEVVRREGLSPSMALGRLLVKTTAGARPPDPGRGRAAEYLASGSLDAPAFIDFIRAAGIVRVETDHLYPWLPGPGAGWLPEVSFHHPYGFITLAARCPWRFSSGRWLGGPCPRPCQGRDFRWRRSEDGLTLTFQGRAQMLRRDEAASPAAIGAGRMVVYP
jgi:hypothetical protein